MKRGFTRSEWREFMYGLVITVITLSAWIVFLYFFLLKLALEL